jgi:hypothetical protein
MLKIFYFGCRDGLIKLLKLVLPKCMLMKAKNRFPRYYSKAPPTFGNGVFMTKRYWLTAAVADLKRGQGIM